MASVDFNSQFSRTDRLLHRMAFNGVEVQKALADIEDRMHARELARITIERPVFVTSLPRAGTTFLLECLAALPEFTTHSYRRMPFLLCPLLWERVSRGLRKKSELSERAHADGMLVSSDSPEAFEEALWMAFWPQKYGAGRISAWSRTDRDPEFEKFFKSHIRKLILLSQHGGKEATRYVSKNNANIARLPLLREIFPDAIILLPFREPFAHASSLLRQHENFLRIHAADGFGRDYMRAIGHLEFGQLLHRITLVPDDGRSRYAPTNLEYWLEYWSETFERLLKSDCRNIHFVSYERMCAEPDSAAELLQGILGDVSLANIRAQVSQVHAPTEYPIHEGAATSRELRRAETVYRELLAVAENGRPRP